MGMSQNISTTILNPEGCNAILDKEYAPISFAVPRDTLVVGIPDGVLALIAPVFVYWVYSLFFHILDVFQLAEKYRIHPAEEITARNRVSRMVVLREVIVQHIIQSAVGWLFYKLDPTPMTGFEWNDMYHLKQRWPILPNFVIYYSYWYGFSCAKLSIAFLIIDSWQFFLHRLIHQNKALYRRFHSRHHQLYVPYAFGALFNDPVEGFLLDTCGTGLAMMLTNLTAREAAVLYVFSTMKTVDDHCGYALPFDLFQKVFPNNSVYHDIHHQHFGIKSNYSQPFFVFWDNLFGTTYHGIDKYKKTQESVTLEKYHQFLADRQAKREKKSARYSDSEDENEVKNR